MGKYNNLVWIIFLESVQLNLVPANKLVTLQNYNEISFTPLDP